MRQGAVFACRRGRVDHAYVKAPGFRKRDLYLEYSNESSFFVGWYEKIVCFSLQK